ncbi:hypothetical protein HCN44_005558 [Aphidius gifuensis]|uniref:Cap-specific mRNA (nucleoside-2'-O-)-methyltransferase 2 n=1 Tax=Aphidius gifuensis TaxID=684658 RepID=A0A834Y3D9_APHGI|nr:hypothetical protein HCN44_005558 [Aphidius gifuensis]
MDNKKIDSKKRHLSPEKQQMYYKQLNYPRSWKNFDRPSATVSITVNKLFTKYYELIIDNDNYKLPLCDNMFIEEPWEINDLKLIKKNLNEMKSRLNDYNLMEWQYHTRKRNQAGDVQWRLRRDISPEFLTQAWCKFYENVSSFPLVPDVSISNEKFKSLHLCEAPGAFIASLNHWLKLNSPNIKWNWIGTTLNPHYEGNSLSTMIKDDRFILHTMNNWYFGVDNTGDLMKLNNLDGLIERVGDDVMLVTADGSINCMDSPDEQELVVSHLHYCETIAALNILNIGGSYLLKLFTIFEHQTICLIYLLSCTFKRIIFNKPVTSKEGNSEIYLICLDFKGQNFISLYINKLRYYYEKQSKFTMFRLQDIPNSFLQQLIQISEFFKSHQCEVISNNIRTFKTNDNDWEIKKIRRSVADNFIRIYKLNKLDNEKQIIGNNVAQSHCETLDSKFSHESYNNRKKKEYISPIQRLTIISEELHSIITSDEIQFNYQFTDKLEDIKITLGLSYEIIQSSRFCITKLLKAFNSTFEIQKELSIVIDYPFIEQTNKYIEENKNDDTKFLLFQYTTMANNNLIIKNLYDTLKTLKKNNELILIGYSLLSQFNVGLLYLLAHTFDNIIMKTNDYLGCIIKLSNFNNNEYIIDYFKIIFDTSNSIEQNKQTILSVVPIKELCDCKMYHSLMQINHWIIKKFIEHNLIHAKKLY